MDDDDYLIDSIISTQYKIEPEQLFLSDHLRRTFGIQDNHTFIRIRNKIVAEGLGNLIDMDRIEITSEARNIVKSGGYINYLIQRTKKQEEDLQIIKIEHEKLIYDLRINKYLFKTRWWPHIISIISIIIAIIALLKKT